jgi:hypothetical protein
MGIHVALPMCILEDNQTCTGIQLVDNPISQRKTQLVDIRYHFVRDCINDNTISVEYCPTKLMFADKPTFIGLRNKIIGDVMKFLTSDL